VHLFCDDAAVYLQRAFWLNKRALWQNTRALLCISLLHSDDTATAYLRLFCRIIGLFWGIIGLICAFFFRPALVMILQPTFKALARNDRALLRKDSDFWC